jgi:hypothetical protein
MRSSYALVQEVARTDGQCYFGIGSGAVGYISDTTAGIEHSL